MKCLEKDPNNRYQSAKEIALDLRRVSASVPAALPPAATANLRWKWMGWAALAVAVIAVAVLMYNFCDVGNSGGSDADPGSIRSLAVLPLQNLSGDPQQDYFADGMTEALITELAQISALRVISRTSVMQYKREPKPVPQIARELNVDAVIEGSVQRSGNQVEITVQLIQARADRHLWAKPYDRDLRDVLALQREVARAIAGEIRVRLTPNEQQHLAAGRQVDRQAYEAFLLGRDELRKRHEASFDNGIQYLKDAIRRDPQYAPAYAQLAGAYQDLGGVLGFRSPQETFPLARAALIKALELEPDNAQVHGLLARQRLEYEWDWRGAEQEFDRALALNPNDPDVHQEHGTYLEALGSFDEAVAERRRAAQLDPLAARRRADVGYPLYYAGRFEEAIAQYRKGLEIDPKFYWAHLWIGQCYVEQGKNADAIAAVKQAIASGEPNVRLLATLGYVYGRAGKQAEAREVLRQLKERASHGYVSPYFFAVVYAGLGRRNETLAALEQTADERHPYLVLVNVEPVFASMRRDPRFQRLLRRLGIQSWG